MSNPSSTLAGSSPANTAPASTVTSNAVAGPSNPTASTSTPTMPNANGLQNGQSVPQPDDVKTEDADLTSDLFAARREEDLARKDRSLAEFLKMLDGYNPLIPDEVTEYYLQRAGFDCSDPRLKRLLSLSAQKFVADLSRDAYHYAKLRTSGTAARRGRPDAGQDKNKVVLTMDDLSLALGEHGVNARKPDYYL